MAMLEAAPAVRRIETNRLDLSAFEVVGSVSAADIENLFGLLEAAYALHPKIDLLLRMTSSEGVDVAGASADTMSDGKAHAGEHIGKCAIVGDRAGLADAGKLFVTSRAIEMREFAPDDEPEAWNWVGGNPV